MGADEAGRRVEQPGEGGTGLWSSPVAGSHGDVAQKALVADVPDGGMAELTGEAGRRDGEELEKGRGRPGTILGERNGKPVPRADCLTDITAKDMISDEGAKLAGDDPLERGRPIGDAAPAIQDEWGDKGLSGACLSASGAGSAAGHGGRLIGLEFKINEELAQKEPGAPRWLDEIGVFADKAEAGPQRVITLEQRPGIDVCAATNGLSRPGVDQVEEAIEAGEHDVMVVGVLGVAGDQGMGGIGCLGRRWAGPIVKADDDDGPGSGQDDLRVAPASDAIGTGKVGLVSVIPGCQPVEVHTQVLGGLGRGDSGSIKSDLKGKLSDLLGEV